MNKLFWKSMDKERQQGFCKIDNIYHCLMCDYTTEDGYIYPAGDKYADAGKQMELHILENHSSVFEHLCAMDKKTNGLSEHQSNILKLFYEGRSDYEVQQELEIGSISTIRNHRYALKEKEKQAKIFITIMELLAKKNEDGSEKVIPHKTATMVDARYDVTKDESEKTLEKYFPNGRDGQLSTFYVKEKYKIIILREITNRFEAKKKYSEKEIDYILKKVYPKDHVVLRRYMIQYGFMAREKDGSAYWIKDKTTDSENSQKGKKDQKVKDKKKAMKQAYMAKVAEEDVKDGVYQIKNLVNNKVYIGTARDISKLNGLQFQLNTGSFTNSGLQKDWTELGEEKFVIEVLESFIRTGNNTSDSRRLRELERNWKEKLKPYGDKGYHRGI